MPCRRNYFQLLDFSIFSRVQRVSKFASVTGSHDPAHIQSRPHPPHNYEVIWFAKVVYTLCLRSSNCSDYFRKNINPFIAFDVIKHIIKDFKNPNVALNFFHFTRLNLNIIYPVETYSFLLRSFCQMGLFDSVKLVSDYMRVDGCFPDNSLLEFLVSSFANAGKFEMAKELLIAQAQSRNDKVGRISSFVFNNLLNLLVKRNRVNEAVSFFRDHILNSKSYCPDTLNFNIVLRGLFMVGEVDKAFEFFNDMGSFGCWPDIVTYNTLINGLCRVGNVDRSQELLREIWSRDGFSPNVVTYTSVISGYCKLGKMEEAINLFDEMIGHGIKPNLVTFNILIDGFGKMGDMVSALNIYERMLILGCTPDVVTFTSLIDGHCRKGHLDQSLRLWDEMNARNFSPNVYTFSVIVNALCKENRLNEARDFLRQLKWRGDIVPQQFLYNPVIDGFCKAGNVDEANLIVMEMEENRCYPDKLTFTILILGHCMKGRMREAISIFNKMLAVGCVPDEVTVRCLISCLLKAGMPNEAYAIRQTVFNDVNLGVSSSRRSNPHVDIPVSVN